MAAQQLCTETLPPSISLPNLKRLSLISTFATNSLAKMQKRTQLKSLPQIESDRCLPIKNLDSPFDKWLWKLLEMNSIHFFWEKEGLSLFVDAVCFYCSIITENRLNYVL